MNSRNKSAFYSTPTINTAVIQALTAIAPAIDDNQVVWQDDALCAQIDPELFFPEIGTNPKAAKRMCGKCSVRKECLKYAIENKEKYGIWGGLSTHERRALYPEIDA